MILSFYCDKLLIVLLPKRKVLSFVNTKHNNIYIYIYIAFVLKMFYFCRCFITFINENWASNYLVVISLLCMLSKFGGGGGVFSLLYISLCIKVRIFLQNLKQNYKIPSFFFFTYYDGSLMLRAATKFRLVFYLFLYLLKLQPLVLSFRLCSHFLNIGQHWAHPFL